MISDGCSYGDLRWSGVGGPGISACVVVGVLGWCFFSSIFFPFLVHVVVSGGATVSTLGLQSACWFHESLLTEKPSLLPENPLGWYSFHSFPLPRPGSSDLRNGRQGGNSGKSVGNLDFKVPQFVVFHRDNLGCFLQKMGAAGPSYWAAICHMLARTDDIRGDTTILRKHSLLGEEFRFPDESSKARHLLKAGKNPCHQVSSDQFTLIYLSLGFVQEGDTTTIYYPICTRVISYLFIKPLCWDPP